MEEKIFEAINYAKDEKVEDIKIEMRLVEDLRMDSLMIMDVIIAIEDMADDSIKPEEMSTLKTVEDIVNLAKRHGVK